jgi:cell fate regulator YaaT (PSP1 superfamily)
MISEESGAMPLVVGVAFRQVTKVYYFDATGHEDLQPGGFVIVETSRGRTMGQVVLAPHEVPQSEISGVLKPVVRRATAWDRVQADQMAHEEPTALAICRQHAAASGIDMKVVAAEYAFDGSSLVVYFTAEQRIDFRNLVHNLAQVLRTRVEMRQVGVRDEAKFLGGFGRCGREQCCASWLREFTPVSIKMAKQQDLPLDASEVSGVCGRLLCCLSYENDFYTEARKEMPRINSILMTPQGPGKVKQVHVLANSVTVQVEGPNDTRLMVEVPASEPILGALGPEAGDAATALVREPRSIPAEDEEGRQGAAGNRPDAGPSHSHGKDVPSDQPRRSRGKRRRRQATAQ